MFEIYLQVFPQRTLDLNMNSTFEHQTNIEYQPNIEKRFEKVLRKFLQQRNLHCNRFNDVDSEIDVAAMGYFYFHK